MQRVIDEAWQNDVIVVVPTGNDGADGGSLATITPQNYGTAANQLITVGGVADTGVFADRTTRDLGTGGSISVYALSESVVGASYQSNTGTMSQDGTSFAAPAVAGLAAYFGALPSLSSQFTAGNVAQQMKNYIIRYVSCYTRSEG
jgi:subtilisin family serine protease